MADENENPKCHLSFLSQPHTLSKRDGDLNFDCFFCRIKKHFPTFENLPSYNCTTSNVEHSECPLHPKKLIHPLHPQHPLTLTIINSETRMMADFYFESGSSNPTSPKLHWFEADSIFDKCSWCDRETGSMMYIYRCSICNFCLDLLCSDSSPPLTIQNPESHHHSLILFARPLSSPCDACGLICRSEPSYVCHQCNYVVHQSCINLPRVIKITRHPHRLFHTPYLPPKISLCRICYRTVDVKYGHYSCKDEDCSYVVHSICTTDKDVWDERELEWEPEEPIEDISPFKNVGDDLIKHFCHDHNLRLEKYNSGRTIEKQCQACILPINSQNFYSCLQCDYVLHEVCASLPRKLDHALHKHPLVLDPSPLEDFFMNCFVCRRISAGFRYKCSKEDCGSSIQFSIDVRCSLVPDNFNHSSHEHPLFISNSYNNDIICNGCKKNCKLSRIQCTLCEYVLCYKCVTIPNDLNYKHDEHPLSLCYGEDTNDKYWCEVCEKQLDPTAWFYTCNTCCITIHKKCVFGSKIYMKSGFTFFQDFAMVECFRNGNCTRQICSYCNNRCLGLIYYKLMAMEISICSLPCIGKAVAEEM